MEKGKKLEALNAKWEAVDLPLKADATQAVPGAGNPDADILFVGEGPGKQEDEQGIPFVGAAGKFLTQLIDSIKLTRDDVFIANTVKHRPPSNRDPLPEELAAYAPWLDEQVKIIEPKVIVTLGRFSMAHFLKSGEVEGLEPKYTISQIHGQPKRLQSGLIVMPMYHPAAALYRGNLRQVLMDDFAKIPKILKLIEKEAVASVEERVK